MVKYVKLQTSSLAPVAMGAFPLALAALVRVGLLERVTSDVHRNSERSQKITVTFKRKHTKPKHVKQLKEHKTSQKLKQWQIPELKLTI